MPRVKDYVREDVLWKAYVVNEPIQGKIWQKNWGWLLDENKKLKKKLDEKTEESMFLVGIREKVIVDKRKLSKFPETTNHMYGWVAKEESFQLDILGDYYHHPPPLPDIYKLRK